MRFILSTVAAAALVLAAAPASAADDQSTAPEESWTGQTAPEQQEEVDRNPQASTVQEPGPQGDPAPAVSTAPEGAGSLEDEVEEVNEATEQRKQEMIEASPVLGSQRLVALAGRDVYSADGRKVGELSEILANTDGEPVVAIVNGDGFLTMDGGQMRVPFEMLEVGEDRLVVPLSYDQVSDRMGKGGLFED